MCRLGHNVAVAARLDFRYTDSHAAASTVPPEFRATPATFHEADPDVDQFPCCTAEYEAGHWRHARARIRRRTASR